MLINSKSNIANLAILGASGYTGAESIRLLIMIMLIIKS